MTGRSLQRVLLGLPLIFGLVAGLGLPGAGPPAQGAILDAGSLSSAPGAIGSASGQAGPGSVLNQATVTPSPTATATASATATLTPTPTTTLTATLTSSPTSTATPTTTSTVTVGTATATTTASPTATLTPSTASGTPGVPAVTTIGQSVSYTGAVTGTWTKTGSGSFSFTATAPTGTQVFANNTPTIFIPTTSNAAGEQFTCTAVPAGGLTTTCTGTTTGDVLLGANVTVVFGTVGGPVSVIGTPTGGGTSLTTTQAQTQAQATAGFLLGTPGAPCALTVGQACNVFGALTGTLTRTGSMSFTLTGIVPAGLAAGITPV